MGWGHLKGTDKWKPARGSGGDKPAGGGGGYVWGDLPEGHILSLKHGASSERAFTPIAEQLAAGIVVERPDLAEPQFAAAVRAWAVAEAQCHLYRLHADRFGMFDDEGAPLSYVATWTKLEVTASNMRARLGLDPVSNAQLIRERASVASMQVDLSGVLERGRQALELRALEGR